MIYYECVGSDVDVHNICARDAEYVHVAGRRRGANAHDRHVLRDVIAAKTCADLSSFVYTSEFSKCEAFNNNHYTL